MRCLGDAAHEVYTTLLADLTDAARHRHDTAPPSSAAVRLRDHPHPHLTSLGNVPGGAVRDVNRVRSPANAQRDVASGR
jgi:hypothetical protein